jgi:hypothetical protein
MHDTQNINGHTQGRSNMNLENAQPHTQVGMDRFYVELVDQYTYLFKHAEGYQFVAETNTPESLARKMTTGLAAGTANKEGGAVKGVCAKLGIDYTYKAIRAYLNGV